MELWLVFALLTVVFYGVSEALSKEPTVRLGPGRMLALNLVYSLPIYGGWFLLGDGASSLNPLGVAYGIASGLSGSLGTALWFKAMESGEASVVSGFTAAYPVITVAATVVGLGATLAPLQLVSIASLVLAVGFLGYAGESRHRATNREWMVPMLFAVLLWGVWGVFEKLAIESIGFAGNAGVYALVSTPVFLLIAWYDARGHPAWDWDAVRAAQPVMVLNAIAGVTIFLAVGLGPLVVVVPLTTAYPVVAILLRHLWKEERMTRAQKVAVGLAMLGAALVSL